MTRTISKQKFAFLRDELAQWQDAHLLGEDQARGILALYEMKTRSFSQALLCGGALLVGLGALSAVAANWWDIPRAFRAAIIIGAYLLCMSVAALCSRPLPRTGRALGLLASFVFGAGIFLTAQMYHQGGHWSTAFGWWAAGVFPAAALLRDRAQAFLYAALTFVFTGGTDLLFWYRDASAFVRWDVLPAVALLGAWTLWRLHKSGALFNLSVLLTLFYGYTRAVRHADWVTATIVFWAAGAACFAAFSTDSAREWKASLAFWGGLVCGIFGLLLSVPEVWDEFPYLHVVESAASGAAARAFKRLEQVLAAGSAALTGLVMLFRLWRGSRMAAVFLVLLALRYFVDHFFGFMSKAAAFSALGALCLALGFWWERRSRSRRAKKEDDHA